MKILLLTLALLPGCAACRCSVSLDRENKPVFVAELMPADYLTLK